MTSKLSQVRRSRNWQPRTLKTFHCLVLTFGVKVLNRVWCRSAAPLQFPQLRPVTLASGLFSQWAGPVCTSEVCSICPNAGSLGCRSLFKCHLLREASSDYSIKQQCSHVQNRLYLRRCPAFLQHGASTQQVCAHTRPCSLSVSSTGGQGSCLLCSPLHPGVSDGLSLDS